MVKPTTTLSSESGMSRLVISISSKAMPSTMSGMKSGRLANPAKNAPPGMPRANTFAASKPKIVEISEAAAPTFSVFPSAARMSSSPAIAAYHFVVKPDSGKAMKAESLNENSGSSSTGT